MYFEKGKLGELVTIEHEFKHNDVYITVQAAVNARGGVFRLEVWIEDYRTTCLEGDLGATSAYDTKEKVEAVALKEIGAWLEALHKNIDQFLPPTLAAITPLARAVLKKAT